MFEPGRDFPAPRMFTARRAAERPQTLGHLSARWHLLVMRHRLMPWQRYVADVFGELDPATGRRVYDSGLVKVPRQQGKTWWLRADMLANSRRPELELVDPAGWLPADQHWLDQVDGTVDELGALWLPRRAGERHDPPPRRIVVYTAQDRLKAREQIVTELTEQQLERCTPLRGTFTARKSNGSERITWRDTGGRLQVEASNDTAGHSLTVDDGVLDEAFAHKDLSIINGIEPTQITKPDPCNKIVSTPGDGSDALMLHYEEVAAIAVNDPDTSFAVFDWSATEDDDRDDPAVWRRVMPALGLTIDERRVRNLLSRTPPAEFDRAYLARRPTSATVAALDPAGWANCRNLTGRPLELVGGICAALEVDVGRTRGVIAVAGNTAAGELAVLVSCQPGTRWMAAAIRQLAHRHGTTLVDVWADRRSGLGGIIDEIRHTGRDVYEVNAGDVASAAGLLYDLTAGDTAGIVHDEQPELDDAVPASRRRPLGADGAWTFSKLESAVDVAPLGGVALAVAAHRRHFPAGLELGGIR